MNIMKVVLYLAMGLLLLGILITFAIPIIIIGTILFLLEAFFGIKLVDRRFTGRFHRGNRRSQPSPAPEPEPDVPAREAVIEVEAVDLPDAPPPSPERIEGGQ